MMKQKKQFTEIAWILFSFVFLLLVAGIHLAFTIKNNSGTGEPLSETSLPTIELPIPGSAVSFVNDSLNFIQDDSQSLAKIYQMLDSLRMGKDTILTIVHLGDSHLQAGYNSGRIMRLMHKDFGNAGRGWISPLKLTKTNEPDDYFIHSDIKNWISGRITQSSPKCMVGPGGIGILSKASSINFDVSIAPNNGSGYWFNQVVLFRHPQALAQLPVGPGDKTETITATKELVPNLTTDTFRLPALTDALKLERTPYRQGANVLIPSDSLMNLYYGFSLTNGKSGVLYHSIGVNGALFENYTKESYLRQLAVLKPSLLIVSLGTNESFGRNFRKDVFEEQLDRFIMMVQTYMPQTTLLLTTPAECYRRIRVKRKRIYVRNDRTELVAQTIVACARNKGIACWDLFTTTGGKGSGKKWFKAGLFGRDRIHFTVAGYEEQGTLFYRAFMHNYNKSIKENAIR